MPKTGRPSHSCEGMAGDLWESKGSKVKRVYTLRGWSLNRAHVSNTQGEESGGWSGVKSVVTTRQVGVAELTERGKHVCCVLKSFSLGSDKKKYYTVFPFKNLLYYSQSNVCANNTFPKQKFRVWLSSVSSQQCSAGSCSTANTRLMCLYKWFLYALISPRTKLLLTQMWNLCNSLPSVEF